MNTDKTFRHLHHHHDPESIRTRLNKVKHQSYVRDFVYGAIDGIVTTFAIVAGVVGAELSSVTILILGSANILADGFSMAASNYLGTKAEEEEKEQITAFEKSEMRDNPEGEKEEIRQIFKAKGFDEDILDKMVENVVSNEKEWLNMMLQEEYGLPQNLRSPLKSAVITFIAFMIFGLIPLSPYILKIQNPFSYATIFTGLAFFTVGSMKSKWSLESFFASGFKTTLIGACAASLAYFTGVYLKGI